VSGGALAQLRSGCRVLAMAMVKQLSKVHFQHCHFRQPDLRSHSLYEHQMLLFANPLNSLHQPDKLSPLEVRCEIFQNCFLVVHCEIFPQCF
jgi:hypothetical protein